LDTVCGIVGDHESQLCSCLLQIVVAPMLLPFRFESVVAREFARCSQVPVDGLLPEKNTPGILIVESAPPARSQNFEGFPIPAEHWRNVRMTGASTVHFVTKGSSDRVSDVTSCVKIGLPVSPFLVPLSLVKTVLADNLVSTFKRQKEMVFDRWSELKFEERIKADAAFYDAPVATAPMSPREGENRSALGLTAGNNACHGFQWQIPHPGCNVPTSPTSMSLTNHQALPTSPTSQVFGSSTFGQTFEPSTPPGTNMKSASGVSPASLEPSSLWGA